MLERKDLKIGLKLYKMDRSETVEYEVSSIFETHFVIRDTESLLIKYIYYESNDKHNINQWTVLNHDLLENYRK